MSWQLLTLWNLACLVMMGFGISVGYELRGYREDAKRDAD